MSRFKYGLRNGLRGRKRAAATAQVFVDAIKRQAVEDQFKNVQATAYSWGYFDALTERPFNVDMVDRVNDAHVGLGLPRHQWYAALPKWARTLPDPRA